MSFTFDEITALIENEPSLVLGILDLTKARTLEDVTNAYNKVQTALTDITDRQYKEVARHKKYQTDEDVSDLRIRSQGGIV